MADCCKNRKPHKQDEPTRFKWNGEMVEDILNALYQYNCIMKFNNSEFNADKTKQYEAVGSSMAFKEYQNLLWPTYNSLERKSNPQHYLIQSISVLIMSYVRIIHNHKTFGSNLRQTKSIGQKYFRTRSSTEKFLSKIFRA